jgi:teichuronic acid biosynthesis glycosyltransferase TuaG
MPFLREAISSVVAQTFRDWELLVVDDGSSDGSAEFAEDWSRAEGRIVPMRTAGRIGSAAARNVGLQAARGRFVAFLDCDDWWTHDKLETQLGEMRRAEAAFSCSSYFVCDAGGRLVRTQVSHPPLTRRRHLLKRTVVGCLTVVIDRELAGPVVFPTSRRLVEDFVAWDELLSGMERAHLTTLVIPNALASYRLSPTGKSRNKLAHASAHWTIFRRVMRMSWLAASWAMFNYTANSVRYRLSRPGYAAFLRDLRNKSAAAECSASETES